MVTLWPRSAEALRLRASGLPWHAVAERMGVSPNTVRNLVADARQRTGLDTQALVELHAAPAPSDAGADGFAAARQDGPGLH